MPTAPLTRARSFSISVEWENARFAELQRTRRMLRALRAELAALGPMPSLPMVNFLFDRRTIDEALVRQVLAEEFPASTTPAEVRVIGTDGLRYYEQKNLGAAQDRTDLVIFLDCDVVPEPGWLTEILSAFDRPEVGVVAGETYVEPENFLSRAFALFWFFPLRDPRQGLAATRIFHANNVAFRREIFEAHPFPDSDTYRGQCVQLGKTLRSRGIGLFVQRSARVSHPCPLGVKYFIGRALHNGRDLLLIEAASDAPRKVQLRLAYWDFRANLRRVVDRVRLHRRDVGLGALGAAGTLALGTAYFSLKLAGALLTTWRPALVPRLIQI